MTVVVPTLAHEQIVLEFLSDAFEQVVLRARGSSRKAPEVFRFDSTRFIGRLRSPDESVHLPMHDVPFEVQIRSAFEHAWSVTTHALTYKSSDVNWSKIRLTSQLKAAVEQMDTLILSFDDAAKYIEPSKWPEIEAKATLQAFFGDLVRRRSIPVELSPKDWSRFVDNVFVLVSRCGKHQYPDQIAQTIKRDVGAELDAIGREGVPLSISLWQLTFASLYKAGSIAAAPQKHWPLITPELEDLYPSLRNFGPRFDVS
jgi:hypothetical protein